MKSRGVAFWDFVDGPSGFRSSFRVVASAVREQISAGGAAWALFGSPRSWAILLTDASPGSLLLLLEVPLVAGALQHLPWVASPPSFLRQPPHTGPAPGLGVASRCVAAALDEACSARILAI